MAPSSNDSLCLVPVASGDLPEIIALEKSSYPADEAASTEALRFRAANASELFRVVRGENNTVIGFVCSTAVAAGATTLSHDSMSTHNPAGTVVCIHSVVVADGHRRAGVGSAIVRMYVEELKSTCAYERVLLLSKEHLVGFYERSGGFVNVGPSAINHGKDTWFELRKELSL
jgi:predicted N-acetyltransferase YhbS